MNFKTIKNLLPSKFILLCYSNCFFASESCFSGRNFISTLYLTFTVVSPENILLSNFYKKKLLDFVFVSVLFFVLIEMYVLYQGFCLRLITLLFLLTSMPSLTKKIICLFWTKNLSFLVQSHISSLYSQ